MALVIEKVRLQQFKSYKDTTIQFNPKFNVIIGDNNIGKTSIFEAMSLWKKCYDLHIQNNKTAFYKSTSKSIYINFEELDFIRLSQDTDIFYGKTSKCNIELELYDNVNEECFKLGFVLSKPAQILNAYIKVSTINQEEFVKFQNYCKNKNRKLNEMIFIHQTKPVSNVLSKEPYMYSGQIKKKIETGKSNEVLRNKIIRSLNKEKLESHMKNVLDMDFSFVIPTEERRNTDEYIDLKVDIEEKELDIFLQGSGFLQVAEIFSTIDILDNALNVLLIDEPDSHISARMQDKLLEELKKVDNTQIFVISHNDNFVNNLNAEEIIFINSDNKLSNIKPLERDGLNILHIVMGGTISTLTRLQKSKKVILVEGDDDIEYIKNLYGKISKFEDSISNSEEYYNIKDIAFVYIRGKDNLTIKINDYKNMITQLVGRHRYCLIFDKDFSPSSANEKLKKSIEDNNNKCKCYTHNGYCIESVLFSNNDILIKLLNRVSNVDLEDVKKVVESYKEKIIKELGDGYSSKSKEMLNQFKGQCKIKNRTELKDVQFNDFSYEVKDNYQYAMNKSNIKEFILDFEEKTEVILFNRDDNEPETYASGLLNLYIDNICSNKDVYDDFLSLLKFILKKE